MARTMSPSMTDGQIDKAVGVLRARLRKHCTEFSSDAAQQVVTSPAFGPNLLAVFRNMYGAVSGLVTRHVDKIDRVRTPQQILDDLGRKQYTDREVVESMPRGDSDEGDVYFFPVSRSISDDDLEKGYQSKGWFVAVVRKPVAQAEAAR